MKKYALSAICALLAAPALAQDIEGDPEAGETQFARQCVACHLIADEEGEVLAGRNARVGPNLYGVIGREPGAIEDFRYSASLLAYGEAGVVWEEENFISYVQDPTGHLREALDDPRARSTMAYQVRSEEDAHDLYAYLATFSPELEDENEDEEDANGSEAAED